NAVLAEKDLEDAQRAVNAKINASVISEIDKKNGGIILNEKDNRSIVAKMKASVKDCARDGSYGKRLLDALSTGDVGAILCANSTNTAIDTATIKKISVEFIDSTLIEVIESFSYENGTFTFYNPQFKKLTDATKLDAAYEVILNEISGGITAAAEEIRKSIGLFSALVPKATTTNLAEKQAAELNGLIGAVREIRRDMAREIADEFNNCEVDMSKKEVTKNGTVEIGSAGMPLAKAIVFLAQDETIQKGASREIDSLKKAKKVIGDLNEKLHPSIFPNLS
ncbi:MAG: hypothetical protein LBB14_01425, partial [Puniceicoccales bacterium]|nr:hypothetical protein [Puniceicoccales bacterium]